MNEQPSLSPVRYIYFDNAAATPTDKRVIEAMLDSGFGNAHAKHHIYGARSNNLVEGARQQVVETIGATSGSIVFTSGATESNNLAIKGLARSLLNQGKRHVITSAVEHKSVLEPIRFLETQGFDVSVLAVKRCGMIEAAMIEKAIRADTGLVSVQAVNNEVGVIQPIEEIAEMLASRDILFHCDAAQALGKIDFSVGKHIDFASLSAHKVYGPQGVGALYVRRKRRLQIEAIGHGGGQEAGLRSGTVPVWLCAGFGKACELIEDDSKHLSSLRWSMLKQLQPLSPTIYGHKQERWRVPGILSLRFPGIEAENLVMELPEIAFGIGSACNATGHAYSHVIQAITGSEQAAKETIRLSFGKFTTQQEVARAADLIVDAVERIRKLQGVAG